MIAWKVITSAAVLVLCATSEEKLESVSTPQRVPYKNHYRNVYVPVINKKGNRVSYYPQNTHSGKGKNSHSKNSKTTTVVHKHSYSKTLGDDSAELLQDGSAELLQGPSDKAKDVLKRLAERFGFFFSPAVIGEEEEVEEEEIIPDTFTNSTMADALGGLEFMYEH